MNKFQPNSRYIWMGDDDGVWKRDEIYRTNEVGHIDSSYGGFINIDECYWKYISYNMFAKIIEDPQKKENNILDRLERLEKRVFGGDDE